MLLYIIVFALSLTATVLLTPKARQIAFLFNALDKPSGRKVHSSLMPRLGGAAIYAGFMTAVSVGIIIALFMHKKLPYGSMLAIMSGGTIIFLLGALDDIRGLSPATKFIWQIIAASVPMFFGVQIFYLSNPFNGVILLGSLAVPLTLLWIVGISNAINLADGLDGLASGITAIASATLFLVAVRIHQPGAAIFLIALSGACLGFLRFNFNPASIFLGDSGSLFLGYILATASVIGVLKSTIFLSLLIPIMILGIPIYDTASVMMRRIRHGDHIFSADKKHLHHRLLNRGFSHRQTVLSIYLACFLLGIGSLALTFLNIYAAVLVIFIIVAVAFYEIRRIKRNVNRYASEESS